MYKWKFDPTTSTLTCPCCWKYFVLSNEGRYGAAYYFRHCPYCGEKLGFEKPYYHDYKENSNETTNLRQVR